MRGPDSLGDRRQIARPFVQNRITDVHVIEQHMRRTIEAVMDHPVREPDLVVVDIGLDAAHEPEVFAKDGGLSHLAFSPENASIPIPMLAIAREPRRNRCEPAVQSVAHALPAGMIVDVRRNLLGAQV